MRLTTQSEYALVCLKALCLGTSNRPVSVTGIAAQENMSKDYVEQLFLKLKRAGIVYSVKGAHGGYVLSREPGQITIREVIEALEGDIYEAFCSPDVREKIVCMHFSRCSLRPVWTKLQEIIDSYFSKITLATLLKDEHAVAEELNLLAAKEG